MTSTGIAEVTISSHVQAWIFQAFHSVLLKWHNKTAKVINNSLLCRKYINGTLNLLTSQYILSELGSSETASTKRCLRGSTALGMR